METKKNYVIGESSALFLKTLEKCEELQSGFIDALELMYGEEEGNKRFNEHHHQLEEIERVIMEYLRINFISEMNGKNETITL